MNKQKLRRVLEKALQSGLKPLNSSQAIWSPTSWLKTVPETIKHDLKTFIEAEGELRIFDQGGMNFGNSMTLVNLDDLLASLPMRTADKGVETTLQDLERYLTADQVPEFDVLAIEGLKLDAPLRLSDDIQLMPFDFFPASITKETLTQSPFSRFLELASTYGCIHRQRIRSTENAIGGLYGRAAPVSVAREGARGGMFVPHYYAWCLSDTAGSLVGA